MGKSPKAKEAAADAANRAEMGLGGRIDTQAERQRTDSQESWEHLGS